MATPTRSTPIKGSDDEDLGHRARIIDSAERVFGAKVQNVTAPGGENRASLRVHFVDRDIIATLRTNFRRTHLEAYVLNALSGHTDDCPTCLGVDGNILFQSDTGQRRLNVEIAQDDAEAQTNLANQAVAAIFRIQNAGRKAGLHETLPHVGASKAWVWEFVNSVNSLEDHGLDIPQCFDPQVAYEHILAAPQQFVKWDCRSGNAAIGQDEKLRWFDFEYAGVRHGAEDFAWLIGDETWPMETEKMLEIVLSNFDSDNGHDREKWMGYLSVYLTFHCVQRLKLINRESQKRGWLSKSRIRRKDDVGAHPDFAANLCRIAGTCAARSKITECLVENFAAAEKAFLAM